MKIVECKHVTKTYPGKKIFRDFNVSLEEGKIYGLLGRNGAGKTTLLNLITNRCLPQKGDIFLFEQPVRDNKEVLLKTCYMSDYIKNFEGMRVGEILRRAAKVYPNWDKKYASDLLSRFHISKRQVYGKISKGQMTCVGLIISMASGCDLVIMDEIYSGLDAVVRRDFYELLLEDYERTRRTFIISSHLIEEMDELFTDVLLIKDGKIIINESYESLIEQSYVITGRPEIVDYIPDQIIIDKEEAETMVRIIVFGKDCTNYFGKLQQLGAEIDHASLQDLFVGMVTEEE